MGNNSGGWKEIMPIVNKENIKHVSFDFWNTLAHPNPVFKAKRTERVADWLNKQISTSEINAAFSLVGREYNSYQESGQPTVSPIFLLNSVIRKLAPNKSSCINELYLDINSIFLEQPPRVDSSFYTIIDYLNFQGCTCSITSNTSFISGLTIEDYLKRCGISNHFLFTIFSDVCGFAKPSKRIFSHLYYKAKERHEALSRNNILHVGDSIECDYYGAIKSGMASFQLKNAFFLNWPRNALHVISNTTTIPFSIEEYSKFKFGSFRLAKKFGTDLFEYFKTVHFSQYSSKFRKIVVFSSPYSQIPTSSYYLAFIFYEVFQNFLEKEGFDKIKLEFGKIGRCQTYTEDYGALSAADRFNLIKSDTYELINIPEREDLCIFIDDISITGAHQRVVEQLLKNNNIVTNCFFLYFAKLENPNISPSFENHLNFSYVNGISQLIKLIILDDYRITTRGVKYILSQNIESLNEFVSTLIVAKKRETLIEIINLSFANGYDKIQLYKPKLFYLESLLYSNS